MSNIPNEREKHGWIADEVKKGIGAFATQDVKAAVRDVAQSLTRQIEEHPYRSLQAAVAVGFGLAATEGEQLKRAALQVGRYLVIHSLSGAALDGGQPQIASRSNSPTLPASAEAAESA